MKSASNIMHSPPKEQFPNLKAQQLYQQPNYRANLQSSKLLGYQPKKKNNDDSSNSKRSRNGPVKPSNSQSKYEASFKAGYMHLSNSQNKFGQQSSKEQVNLSHNLDRSPNQQSTTTKTKKRLAGVLATDDVSLPPLGYGASRTKMENSLDSNLFMPRSSQPNPIVTQDRLSAKPSHPKVSVNVSSNGKKLSYMVSSNYKQSAKKGSQKAIQSQYLQSSPQEEGVGKLTHQYPIQCIIRSFSPGTQQELTECDSPLLPPESIPPIDPSKVSSKNVGMVSAYGANTHQGLVRNYNEDRVSIILNMMKPASKPNDMVWPQCSFFAVYDGHGGSQCAEFLRDNLHYYIIRDEHFPQSPKTAIKRGFDKAEKAYLEIADSGRTIEKSGSCAVCALIIDQNCYIANVGDSRAVVSQEQGQKAVQITVDHKPNHPDEEQRIISHGGQIYQSQIPVQTAINKIEYITGPFRVLPGRLAVSRTMGDSEAKLPKYNGIPNVISAEPDVFSFKINEDCDFLLLGCDGIFDKMSTKDVVNTVWNSYTKNIKNVHDFTGKAIENVMRLSLQRKSFDNVTVVFVAFSALEKYINYKKQQN